MAAYLVYTNLEIQEVYDSRDGMTAGAVKLRNCDSDNVSVDLHFEYTNLRML